MESKKYAIFVKKSFVAIKKRHRRAAHSECNLRYKMHKEIPVVFHNGSTCDYHFIIKKLAEEFEGEFECLGENTEKYITFSVPLKKENDNGKKITYKLKFIDSYRFMSTLLSNLVDNLLEFMIKNVRDAWKEKEIRINCGFIGFKNSRLNYKCIYPYEYIDIWERFDKNTIQPNEAFYSELNLENITDKRL